MKKIELARKTVIITRRAGWFIARYEGKPNLVFGETEEQALFRLERQLSVGLKVKYERA